MKTLTDIFNLIAKETELNEGMLLQHQFDINTKHEWVSMYKFAEGIKTTLDETIFSHESFKDEANIQKVYWLIYTNGRSKDL
tara:strand:- start:558 stop:803 length:246 start_codon:yes stop_codon:yes gene_type:complete